MDALLIWLGQMILSGITGYVVVSAILGVRLTKKKCEKCGLTDKKWARTVTPDLKSQWDHRCPRSSHAPKT